MKRIMQISILVISILFLTGCWFKKKTNMTENSGIEIKSDSDKELNLEKLENIEIKEDKNDFEDCKNEETPLRKSIFDEGEQEEDLPEIDDNSLIEKNVTEKEQSDNKIQNINDILTVSDYSGNKDEINTSSNKENMCKIGTIMFDFDVYKEIRQDQNSVIDLVLNDAIQRYYQNKNIKFVIKGHACDSAGSEKYNMQLSDKRAKTISKKLEAIGVNKQNISSFGCGTSEIINHGNREEQAINRRAEIYILN